MWIFAAIAVLFLLKTNAGFASNVTNALKNFGLVTAQPSWFAHPASAAAAKATEKSNLSVVGGNPVASNSNAGANASGGTTSTGSPSTSGSPTPAPTTRSTRQQYGSYLAIP